MFGPKAAENHEDLRGILNAGHSRNRPYIRWDVASRAPEHCPTFALAALAGIGALPDTITDRAVVVKMRRRAPGEHVDRYRDRRDGAPLKELGATARRMGPRPPGRAARRRARHARRGPRRGHLGAADRRRRPRRRRLASTGPQAQPLTLTAEDDTDTTLGARLLADLRDVFGDADAMHGETILAALHKLPEEPWSDYFGRPMNARDMAKLLRPYGVRSVRRQDRRREPEGLPPRAPARRSGPATCPPQRGGALPPLRCVGRAIATST